MALSTDRAVSETRKRVVVTDNRFSGVSHERQAAESRGATLDVFDCRTARHVTDALRDADVAFVNLVPVDADALAAMRPAGLVIRYGIGTDNVDLAAAARLGRRVANVPDYGSDTVADHAAAAMLALLRRLPTYDAAMRRDGWPSPAIVPHLPALSATTVGLLGVGRIGHLVGSRLQAFGIRVLATDPYADVAHLQASAIEAVPFDDLLARSNGLSLHLPATPETRGIIGREALGRMREGAVLVNTARGALVDEAALIEALQRGHLSGAALDVFEPEPLAPASPLRQMSNVLLSPHAAFYSAGSLDALQRLAAEEAGRALDGDALRCQVA